MGEIERHPALRDALAQVASVGRAALAATPAGSALLQWSGYRSQLQLERRLTFLEQVAALLQVQLRDVAREVSERDRASDLFELGAQVAQDAPDDVIRRLVARVVARGIKEGNEARAFVLANLLDRLLVSHLQLLEYAASNPGIERFGPAELPPELDGLEDPAVAELVARGLLSGRDETFGGGLRYYVTPVGHELIKAWHSIPETD